MPFVPTTLTVTAWSTPVTITENDSIKNLDNAINDIVDTNVGSIKNHINTELGKVPAYLTANLNALSAEFNTVVGNITAVETVAGMNAEVLSLYADKTKLDSLYADKAKLDSIFADKANLDSIFADKVKLDSIYADKASLDAIHANLVAILAASTHAANAQLRMWEAEAAKMTAEAYASTAKDVFVKEYTSSGNGLFAETITTRYSTLHWAQTIDDANIMHKTGDETKTGTLTLESSPIIPDPTAAQHAASKNYVDIRTGLDPLIYSLGQPGEIGFGVATAPKALYEQIGAIPLSGHDVLGHENYGNYMHGYSGAILCFVPKNYIKITGNLTEYATVPTTGYVLDRSFINGGLEIPGVFIAKYTITKNGTIASAQRFKDPMSTNSAHNPISTLAGTPVNNYGGLYTAVKTMSAEAFLTPAYHYSMLERMARAHGAAALSTTACAFIDVLPKLPKGNNNNALADAQDASVLYTASGYSNCGLTGSASTFVKTTHNGQACGIADLNGNMWEVASGFIRYTANGFLMLKESVDIRTIVNDSITAGAGGAYDVNLYDVIDISDVVFDATTTYFGNGTNQVFAMSTDRLSAAYKRTMFGIPAATGVSATGTTDFGNDGFYRNLVDQMACIRGGRWANSSVAGVAAVLLSDARAISHDSVGGRASFLCV